MDTSKTQVGIVVRYDREKHFGFIETEDQLTYFFFFDKAMQLKFLKDGGPKEHVFSSGDEVEFRIRKSVKDASKWEAYDLVFLQNTRRALFLESIAQQPIQQGYLKRINTGKLFIKPLSSDFYMYIPVQISDWELDIEKFYKSRIDQVVEFKLTQTIQIYKLMAVLTETKFCKEYIELESLLTSQKPLPAKLLGKNADGYFTTILDGKVEAFLRIPTVLTDAQKAILSNLKQGDELPVTVKQIYLNRKVSLSLSVS